MPRVAQLIKARGVSPLGTARLSARLAEHFTASYTAAGGPADALNRVVVYEVINLVRWPSTHGRTWEALDLFTNVQHSWTKVKPARLTNAMSLLLHHARRVQDLRARV